MRARGEDGRGTVGFLQVLPASRNVVPGEVRFSVEFRHPSDAQIQGLAESFPEEARKLVEANGCKLELTELFRIPAQPLMLPALIWCVRPPSALACHRAKSSRAPGMMRFMSRVPCQPR
jgi:N-carbamoyl-L-amino-acid hydrolase